MLTSELLEKLNKSEYKDYTVCFRSEKTYDNGPLTIGSVDYFLVDDAGKRIILCQEWI